MYQGDSQRNEAQPQDDPKKEAQEEVEICAQDKIKNLMATIEEKEEAILDLTGKLNLKIKLQSDSESNTKALYSEREYLKVKAESLAINLAAQTQLGIDSGKAWQRRFSALEEESEQKEKVSDSKFRATVQEKEEANLDLTEKLNLEIKLRSESESNTKALYSEREYLKVKVESLTINLAAQTQLGIDSGKAWQRRFSALEKESDQKEKASDSKFRAKIQEKEEAILDLTERLNLEIKLGSESESNTKVLQSEREYLKVKVESLTNNLAAQTKLGHDSNKAWQRRFLALEEESDQKEKASDSKFRSMIQEKEEANLDLTEKLNLEIKLRSDSESNTKVLQSEREDLEAQVKSLANDLAAQTKLVSDNDKAWQLRFSALEESNKKEKSSESNVRATIQEKEEAILDLTEKLNLEVKLRSDSVSNAEVLQSEREYLENQVKSLANDLEAQTKLVSDNDKAWQDKISTLKQERTLKEKTIRTACHTEREDLLRKLKEQSCKMHSLQVKCESLAGQNNHEEELQRMRREIVNLEDICLRQKKKNLGCFGRRMGDREVELERMKRKVPAREPVDPPPPGHSPSPVDPPPPEVKLQ